MSGGSYLYLADRDVSDLFAWNAGYGDALVRMIEYLEKARPSAKATRDLRQFKADMDTFVSEMELRWNALSNVMHAVEWVDCGDWGEDAEVEAIEEYEKK